MDGAKKIARFVIITIVIVACLLAVFTLAINNHHKANQNYQQVKK
jgi:cell division protein FtsX